jgi:CheY-like chemotaxis protein
MKNKESLKKEKQKKVLLVEDHKYSLIVLQKMLEQSGIFVVPVENGQEAVNVFQENPDIDLIFMDIKMPVMDGYAAMREIKKLNPKVKIIAETAYARDGDEAIILNAGFDGYISKPITKASLEKILDLFLKY